MLSQVILFSGLAIIAVCLVIYAVVSYIDREPQGSGQGYNGFDPNFHEHQNYWEAENR